MSILLQIEKLDKYYGNKHNITKALNHVSFQVEKGEFLGIMGSSGSGKTTLLNCLATICRATAGHIYLEGRDITALKNQELADFRKENLGFVFQDFNLLDHFTLEENIGLALTLRGTPKEQVRKLVKQAARQLGIEGELEKMPAQVSGGQKQRCACARAIINHPKILLADEPTGALDSKSSRLLLETMSDINQKMQATILMVTHDPFSASFCKRILFLKDGKIFNEIFKGEKSRKEFFNEILDILTLLGGEVGNVR